MICLQIFHFQWQFKVLWPFCYSILFPQKGREEKNASNGTQNFKAISTPTSTKSGHHCTHFFHSPFISLLLWLLFPGVFVRGWSSFLTRLGPLVLIGWPFWSLWLPINWSVLGRRWDLPLRGWGLVRQACGPRRFDDSLLEYGGGGWGGSVVWLFGLHNRWQNSFLHSVTIRVVHCRRILKI